MKKLILMFLFIIPLFSCGGSDEEIYEAETQTFLEKYDGTLWLADMGEMLETEVTGEMADTPWFYLKINNSIPTPLDFSWYMVGPRCFTVPHYSGYNFIENNINSLVIEVEGKGGFPSTVFQTFTVKDDVLIGTFESGEIITLKKSNRSLDDLKMCSE